MKRHYYITGFMGAGKSKIGRALAEMLNLPFVDTDHLIEQEAGMSIRAIFSLYGENHFRELERQIMATVSGREQAQVISPGGGALLDPETFARVRQTGWIIYVKSKPEEILNRVKHSKKRPLLAVPDGPDYEQRLLAKIVDLLNQREPHYLQADLVFDRDGLEWQQAAQQLKNLIEKELNPKMKK